MTDDDFDILEKRFYGYTDGFIARAQDAYPYTLEQEHTLRVCENIFMLAGSLGLGRDEANRAKAAALVHDMGRFPQFGEYGTFPMPCL